MSSMNEGMSPVIYQRLTSNEDWVNLGLWHGLHFKCTDDGAKQESSRPICDEKIQHEIPLRRHGIVLCRNPVHWDVSERTLLAPSSVPSRTFDLRRWRNSLQNWHGKGEREKLESKTETKRGNCKMSAGPDRTEPRCHISRAHVRQRTGLVNTDNPKKQYF